MAMRIPGCGRWTSAGILVCAVLALAGALLPVARYSTRLQASETEICTRCGLLRDISYAEVWRHRLPFTTTCTEYDTPVSAALRAVGAGCAGPHTWVHVHGCGAGWSSCGPGFPPRYNAKSDVVAVFLSRLYVVDRDSFEKWRTEALRADDKNCRILDFVLTSKGKGHLDKLDVDGFREWWDKNRRAIELDVSGFHEWSDKKTPEKEEQANGG